MAGTAMFLWSGWPSPSRKCRIADRIAQRQIQPAQIIAWPLWRRAHQAAARRAQIKQKMQLE
ncbi:hypothetical protein [Paracoccus halophilus]|uniref:hypothetical protein n=1 Tax=Paracoccus halophilus TaxID=376733 RepID=UPI00094242E3|nr:hypothetical protein [Paracoccus halophilus]